MLDGVARGNRPNEMAQGVAEAYGREIARALLRWTQTTCEILVGDVEEYETGAYENG